MVEFERHFPDTVPDQAREWLREASKSNALSYVNADNCISLCASGAVQIYTIDCDGKLSACFCITFRDMPHGRIMNMLLLGGENIGLWKDAFVEFLEATAKKYSCTDFTMMGPLAWKKMFPMLELVTCVYRKTPQFDKQL